MSKKKFMVNHAKSSAAFISLIIHAVLILFAVTFVAVSVIKKDDQQFETKPVNRPKMQLKKLQVPVNIKKTKTQKPRLRKRIVVQPKLNQSIPDIKMPEITGVKGGMGNAAGSGLGGASGLGFNMTEFSIFGIKGKGEKVFLILDAGPDMMYDEMGGIPAYAIIKEELARIVEELPPTALFNLCVYEKGTTHQLFPKMVPANDLNLKKVETYLKPLNGVKKGMGDRDYGLRTLGQGGASNNEDMRVGPFVVKGKKVGSQERWFRPVMLAMQQQADSIFILTNDWGQQRYQTAAANRRHWEGSADEAKWNACHKKGLAMLDAENRKRAASGRPPRVLSRNIWTINTTYFPAIKKPPKPEFHTSIPKEFAEGFSVMRKKSSPASGLTSGLTRKKNRKKGFSLNVVLFAKENGSAGNAGEKFKTLTSLCDGEMTVIKGMEAIKSYVDKDRT